MLLLNSNFLNGFVNKSLFNRKVRLVFLPDFLYCKKSANLRLNTAKKDKIVGYFDMKRYLVIALASLFAFASCSKESIETSGTEETKENVSVLTFTSQRPLLKSDTKTAWDASLSTIVWSTGDKIRVGYTKDGQWMGKDAPSTSAVKFFASNDIAIESGRPNYGSFSIPVGGSGFAPQEDGECVFYGIYPYKAIENTVSIDPDAPSLTVTLPTIQTPAANSFDALGDIMIGKTAAYEGFPEDTAPIYWTRIVAHLDLTFKNLSSVPGFTAGETVSSIKLTTDKAITGTFTLNLTDNSVSNASSNKITINGSNLSFNSDGNIEAWACVLPITMTSLEVAITTNKAIYRRSFTATRTFKQNARNTMGVNMATATREDHSDKYVLVSDTDELTEESEVIIVSRLEPWAMSTTQNDNNRNDVRITKTTDVGVTYIENPSESVQIFTLEQGTKSNTIAFKCKNVNTGYIYAASSSNNYLRTKSDKDDNASFTVDIEDNGAAIIVAQGENTINTIRHNLAGGKFSCYNTGQYSVSIFKKVDTGNGNYLIDPVPHIKVTSDNPLLVDNTAGNQTITYTLAHILGGGSVSATTDVSWISNINCTNEHVTFDFAANGENSGPRKGHITLSYSGAPDVVVTVEQAAGDNAGYRYTYTSNVTSLTGTSIFEIIIDDEHYNAYCAGSGSNPGSVSFTVPAGTTKIYFHAVRWAKGSEPTVSITSSVGAVGSVTPSLNNLRVCPEMQGTAPYTITTSPETDFYELTVSGITSNATITMSTDAANKRFIIWGVNAVEE